MFLDSHSALILNLRRVSFPKRYDMPVSSASQGISQGMLCMSSIPVVIAKLLLFWLTGVQHILSNSLLWELASINPQSERDSLIFVESLLQDHHDSEGYLKALNIRNKKLREVNCRLMQFQQAQRTMYIYTCCYFQGYH